MKIQIQYIMVFIGFVMHHFSNLRAQNAQPTSINRLYASHDPLAMIDEEWLGFSGIVKALRDEAQKDARLRMSYIVIGTKSYGFTLSERYVRDSDDPFLAKRKIVGYSICLYFADTGKSLIRTIPDEMVSDLDGVWLHYCKTAKYYEEYETGVGGATHYFGISSNAIHPLAGRTWTPKPNSPLDRLIVLADSICLVVKAGGAWTPVKAALSAAIKDIHGNG